MSHVEICATLDRFLLGWQKCDGIFLVYCIYVRMALNWRNAVRIKLSTFYTNNKISKVSSTRSSFMKYRHRHIMCSHVWLILLSCFNSNNCMHAPISICHSWFFVSIFLCEKALGSCYNKCVYFSLRNEQKLQRVIYATILWHVLMCAFFFINLFALQRSLSHQECTQSHIPTNHRNQMPSPKVFRQNEIVYLTARSAGN